jgi:DNA recombination protein RmuC
MNLLTALAFGLLGLSVGLVAGLLAYPRIARVPARQGPGDDIVTQVGELLESARERDIAATARVDARLEGLASDLGRVGALVRHLETGRAEQYGDLSRHLQQTLVTTSELAATTRDLRQVLASNNARGQWGERMADDVLRAAGLVEGVNYLRQQRLPTGGVPDVTLLLPRGRRLHMDVKFPFTEYVRYLEAGDDVARARHRAAFLRDARARIAELSRRDYLDADDGIGVALLLIPNESVFAFLQQHAAGLFDEAMRAGVTVCSPLTLFAVLAVVRQAVDSVELAEASAEIRQHLHALELRWRSLTEDLDKLGRHLRHAARSFEQINGAGRRDVDRALDRAVHPTHGAERETTAADLDGPVRRSLDAS